MLKYRVSYILLVLSCVGFSMAYVGKISHILLFVVLLYPVPAFVLTLIQLILADADFTAERIAVNKDMMFDLGIEVRNRFIFPAVPVEVLCSTPDAETGLFAEKRLFVSLPPFSKCEVSVRSKHIFRGSYTCRLERIYVVDPFRIIRLSKKCERSLPTIFFPRKLKIEELIFRSAVEQSYAQKRINTADKEDFSHVREYRDGDVLQMVHWKLTAKQEELMIKQFDSINDLRAVILCDYHQENDFNGMTIADMVAETAFAFAKTALDKGIHSTVDFGDFNSRSMFISDLASLNEFFNLVSAIPPDLHTEDFISMIDGLDKSSAAVLVLVTPNITEDVLQRARYAAQQVTVLYAYLNIERKRLEYDFSNERFVFLNILGTDENAINAAVLNVMQNTGERL